MLFKHTMGMCAHKCVFGIQEQVKHIDSCTFVRYHASIRYYIFYKAHCVRDGAYAAKWLRAKERGDEEFYGCSLILQRKRTFFACGLRATKNGLQYSAARWEKQFFSPCAAYNTKKTTVKKHKLIPA